MQHGVQLKCRVLKLTYHCISLAAALPAILCILFLQIPSYMQGLWCTSLVIGCAEWVKPVAKDESMKGLWQDFQHNIENILTTRY